MTGTEAFFAVLGVLLFVALVHEFLLWLQRNMRP
jgi:hypothetical protein